MIPECDSISASVPVTRVLSCPVIMERGVIWREGFTFITWLPVVDQQEGRKAGRQEGPYLYMSAAEIILMQTGEHLHAAWRC